MINTTEKLKQVLELLALIEDETFEEYIESKEVSGEQDEHTIRLQGRWLQSLHIISCVREVIE